MLWVCESCKFRTDDRAQAVAHGDQIGHMLHAFDGKGVEWACMGNSLVSGCSKVFRSEADAEEHTRTSGHVTAEFVHGLPTDFQMWPSDSTLAVYDNGDQLRGQGKVEGIDFAIERNKQSATSDVPESERALRVELDEIKQRNEELVAERDALAATVVEQTEELRRLKDGR